VLRQVALIGEAREAGDLVQGEAGEGQQFSSSLDAVLYHVLVRAEAGRKLEHPGEVEGVHGRDARDLRERQVRAEVVAHVVGDAPQRALREAAGWLTTCSWNRARRKRPRACLS
jgi:hypothetical protein